MIDKILENSEENIIQSELLELYKNSFQLNEHDKSSLKNFSTMSYSLLGVIGLLLQDKARILLGKKQGYNGEIQKLCEKIEITQDDLTEIANIYLDDLYAENEEYIYRKVMLEYPNK